MQGAKQNWNTTVSFKWKNIFYSTNIWYSVDSYQSFHTRVFWPIIIISHWMKFWYILIFNQLYNNHNFLYFHLLFWLISWVKNRGMDPSGMIPLLSCIIYTRQRWNQFYLYGYIIWLIILAELIKDRMIRLVYTVYPFLFSVLLYKNWHDLFDTKYMLLYNSHERSTGLVSRQWSCILFVLYFRLYLQFGNKELSGLRFFFARNIKMCLLFSNWIKPTATSGRKTMTNCS